jgi:ATP-dependent DNA helicase UvrD/PcrA
MCESHVVAGVAKSGALRDNARVDPERELNPAQREAVEAPDGAVLCLAGAGSGKTRVLTWRVAHLVKRGVPAHQILAVTFTNKAAGEMRRRVEGLLGERASGLWMGTFHSVCARLLRIHGERLGLSRDFVILDDDDQRALITKILKELDLPERMFAPRLVLSHIDRAKNRGLGPDDYRSGDFLQDAVARAYREYQRRLLQSQAVDFGDLLLGVLRLLDDADVGPRLRGRFAHVLVDEFQDTNRVQYLLARGLVGSGSLYAVGDPDQSIYAFRGADLRNILDFEHDYPAARVVKLEQNYRSTPTILAAAASLIDHNLARKRKTLWTENQDGPAIVLCRAEDERREAEFVVDTIRKLRGDGTPLSGVAVFYRTHAQSRAVEEALRAANYPYAIVGGMRFYERAEVKDVLAYLRVLMNPRDEVDLLRIVNVPARGIGDTTLQRVAERAAAAGGTLYDAIAVAAADPEDLGAVARRKLGAFHQLMEDLRRLAETVPPSQLAEAVLERTGYLERLAAQSTLEAEGRVENLLELVGSMRAFESEEAEPTLATFLERVALQSDVDGWDESEGKVTLMTVHSAKGLEFPAVFLIGLDDGVFPHARALAEGKDDDLEEERRLCYVAMTRARRQLHLATARVRRLYGQEQVFRPSQFLDELGDARITTVGRGRPAAPQPRRAGEVWLDVSESQAPQEDGYFVGMRVRHAQFGDGQVRAFFGRAPDVKLTIYFPSAGLKTILARYLQSD